VQTSLSEASRDFADTLRKNYGVETGDQIVAACASRRDEVDEFVQAHAAYEASCDAYSKIDADLTRRRAAAEAESPIPKELADRDGGGFLTQEFQLEGARFLTFAQKAELLPIQRAWREAREAARARHGLIDYADEEDDPSDLAHNARFEAGVRFLGAAAPDAVGLALQLRATINLGYLTEVGEDADDEHTISRLITPSVTCMDEGRLLALNYRSALRLAGMDSPALEAEPFDPSVWIVALETACPGVEVTNRGLAWHEAKDGSIAPHQPASSCHKGLRPWQRKAVKKAALKAEDGATDWLVDFEDAGGCISFDPDGGVRVGGPLEPGDGLDTRTALLAELESDKLLRRRVAAKAADHFAGLGADGRPKTQLMAAE
jgi:hypothetical protein